MNKVHQKSDIIKNISITDEIPQSLRSQQKDMDGRSFRLRKISRNYRPRVIISGKELAIRFWIAGAQKPKIYKHSELRKLDEFISNVQKFQQ